jgi:hypothetical protein
MNRRKFIKLLSTAISYCAVGGLVGITLPQIPGKIVFDKIPVSSDVVAKEALTMLENQLVDKHMQEAIKRAAQSLADTIDREIMNLYMKG